MKKIFIIVASVLLINNLYSRIAPPDYMIDDFFYPVYSIKLDKVNSEIMKVLIVDKQEIPGNQKEYTYTLNLNNYLKFREKTADDYLYNVLGDISVDKNNKLSYKEAKNLHKDIHYKKIQQKQRELKINIEYINNNDLSIEEIKKILDVDLLSNYIGHRMLLNNQYKISVQEALANLRNCRFCEQMMRQDDYKIYRLIHYSIEVNFYDKGFKGFPEVFKEINEHGNIYKQLKYGYQDRSTLKGFNVIY